MKGFRERAEVAEVLRMLDARVECLETERVEVVDAAGRVLAAEVRSSIDVPHFDRAAMDGYAVRAVETFGATVLNPVELRVTGESLPAAPSARPVEAGEAVRLMTGAPMPEGADAIVVAEAAEERNGVVLIRESIAPGRHIGRRGEDVVAGSSVLPAGRVLRPQDLALLLSIGEAEAEVVRRPVVDVFVTGNELLPTGSKPSGFSIVDSNSVMLAALVVRDGGKPRRHPVLRDDPVMIREAFERSDADAIVVSGGSSVGSEDYAPGIVAELGELAVHGIAIRPASPAGIGFVGGRAIFLLPGNPVSCLCAYDFFAGRAIRKLGGRPVDWPHRRLRGRLARKIASAVGRVDYVRVRIEENGMDPISVGGASILTSTTRADGFVIVDRDSEGHAPGEEVEVFLYD
jgi:molybdopterin molybdotransferase